MNSTKFFEDNIARLSPNSDPIGYNLNCGLLQLAKEVRSLQAGLDEVKREIARVKQDVQRLPSR